MTMQYYVGDTKIFCPCCRNDSFEKDYRQLNTQGATFFGFDWANKSATILVCLECSYISWFMADPKEI
ncbi:hypothetical protein D3C77_441550 [compost metagenome]